MFQPNFNKIMASVGAGLLFASLLLAIPLFSTAQGPNQANIIVQFNDTDAIVRPVNFSQPISGLKALELTGLALETVDFGGGFIAVCSINGVGCPADDCFCGGNSYWGYNYWDGSGWEGYQIGATDSVITNSAVEGWRWGEFGASLVYATPYTAASKGLTWLEGQQVITSGDFGGIGASVETMLTLGANQMDASAWGNPSLEEYVYANGAAYAENVVAASGKLAVAVVASNSRWPLGAKKPMDYYVSASGIYTSGYGAGYAGGQSWAILGTAALGHPIPPAAVTYLKSIANSDGGWGWGGPNASDTNGTALAIQALVVAGEPLTSTAIVSGFNYLMSAQNPDGGFPYDPASPFGTASDTNSTAYVVQALFAGGSWYPVGTGTLPGTGSMGSAIFTTTTQAVDYLLQRQLSDGSFEWQAGSGTDQRATQQAIPALLDQPFPFKIAERHLVFLPLVLK